LAKINYYGQDRQEVIDFVPDDASILLDIGCGAGAFGAALKERKEIEVWGVEPVVDIANEAEAVLDKVVTGFFEENAHLPDAQFDVITFNDSLEHFPDPFPPLVLAKKKLKKDTGLVVASIPNVRFIRNIRHVLFEKDWKYTDKGILDRTHLRFFTKKSMVRTFEEAGYEVISITGINPHRWNTIPILFLRMFFGSLMADMRFAQFVVVARES